MSDQAKMSRYSLWQVVADIRPLLRPYRGQFWFASLMRLLGDVANLFPAYALAFIVSFLSTYSSGQSTDHLWLICVLFAGAVLLRGISQFCSKYWGYRVAEMLEIDSTMKAIQHMFLLDMSWHEKENAGNKLKRIQKGGEAWNNTLRLWFNCYIEITVNLLAINWIIATFDRGIMLLVVVFLIVYFTISVFLTKKAIHASTRVNQQQEHISGLLFESLNNIKTVKVMSMAETFVEILKKSMLELVVKIRRRIFCWQFRNSLLGLFAGLVRVLILAIIINGIFHGHYSLGFLILFNSYFYNLLGSIDELSTASQDFATARVSIWRMKEVLHQSITIDDETHKRPFPKDWQRIVFEDVFFAYGDNQVLKDISFEVQRGEKVGIVGLSGAGKSTLFKLLLKEREEFLGEVSFDDVSIKDISKHDYFKHVSVVLQDTEVFNFSLRDNVTITNDSNKDNEELFKQSLEIAHITDFVDKLPQGVDTLIGEKGVKLSGGERQRLGIARAIFKQPEILLLDEATSHLDLASEEKIRDSLDQFFENVTAIVIAHRLTTIREMDKILVIEDGKLIESGSFDALQAQKGRFSELWAKQRL